jgi:anti-sigma-K factor RskA
MNCEEVAELAGAYAAGALPADELEGVEEHLRTCTAHADLLELSAVARSIALSAPDAEPPSALKSRIMDVVRRESEQRYGPQYRESLISRLRARLGESFSRAPLMIGALAMAVVVLLLWNLSLQLDGGGATVERQFVATGDAGGSVRYISDEEIVLMSLHNLERLPASSTYQVWAIADGVATGVGFVESVSEDGQATQAMSLELSDGQRVAITIEPAGGSLQPTTEPILEAEI